MDISHCLLCLDACLPGDSCAVTDSVYNIIHRVSMTLRRVKTPIVIGGFSNAGDDKLRRPYFE